MLTIRNEQLRVLGEKQDHQLAALLTGQVLETLPVLRTVLSEEAVAAAVRDAVVQARGFGLETDQQVGEFVGLVFVCGERFFEREDYAWARELLRTSRPTRVREVGVRIEQQLAAAEGGR